MSRPDSSIGRLANGNPTAGIGVAGNVPAGIGAVPPAGGHAGGASFDAGGSSFNADGAFDDVLRKSLASRPVPAAPSNLADQAMRWAATQDRTSIADWRVIERHRRWNRLLSAMAALVVVSLLAVLAWQMIQRGDTGWLASNSDPYTTLATGVANSADGTVGTTTSTASTSSYLPIILMGGSVAVCVVIVISITTMLSGDRREALRMPRWA